MIIRKYQLTGILEQCQQRGLTTIQEILDELKEFKNTDVVVQTLSNKEVNHDKRNT